MKTSCIELNYKSAEQSLTQELGLCRSSNPGQSLQNHWIVLHFFPVCHFSGTSFINGLLTCTLLKITLKRLVDDAKLRCWPSFWLWEVETLLRPVQTLATLLAKKMQHCWAQLVASVCTPCCVLLRVVACCCDLLEVVGWGLKLVKLQSQQVPTFLLFRGHRSVVQQCCVRLHSTSNNVAPVHAHYMPRIHTNTCEQEIKMASEMENVPESFVFSSKDPTCCDLLRAFEHIG